MATITTHKYTSKTNNKENESCNGKRDEAKASGRSGPRSDYEKQEAINQQRKLRLNQVRQQSKEIASQMRENVRYEEKRQLDKVNEVKRNEMLNWRQKQIGQKDKDFKSCLEQVGEAHLAAERENMAQRRFEEQKEKNRKLALKRGKLAAQKIKGELKLNKCKPIKVPEKRVNIKPMATEAEDDSDSSISSETSSDESVIFIESNKDAISKPKTDSSLAKMPKSSPLNVKWSHETDDYDPTKFTSINSSTTTDISLTDSPAFDSPPVISKVSKLLQKSHSSDPRISKTYKLTKSQNKSSQNRFSTPPEKEQKVKTKITTISSRLKKGHDDSPGQIGLEKKQFVPEFVKNKSVPSTNRVGQLNQVSNALRQKVNFYDHCNRFSKQYESAISLEENVHEIVPPNAWEDAERDIQRQRELNRSKLDMRQFEENRAKIALEKDRIRKEYDLMSKDLRNILKDESLSKNVSQGYESMLESHSLSNSTTVRDKCDSSMLLDFVTTRTNKICDDIDRCRSENGKNKSRTKIEALHGLLKKVNSLRKILFEEIKQNDKNGIDAKEIINEISKLEEEQQKIMSGKSPKMDKIKNSYPDRERTLSEREEILKMKESCIDEKARELYLREKEIQLKKKVVQTSNGIPKDVTETIKVSKNNAETVIEEIPVKIVINVNKGDKTNERSADFIVNDVKWCERLRKTVQATENRTTEPIRTESGKVYPKTPAIKTKSIPIEQKQSENSSQSTSITAYMNPPELIQTQLSSALRQTGMLPNLKTQICSNMNDNEMLHYIIRLLGMSRTSIEQLNLSTVSTVKTPDSSVINVSSNKKFIASSTSTPLSISSSCSVEQTESIETNKLHQLARFLCENGNLRGNGERQSRDSIENTIWNNILSQKKEKKPTKTQTYNKDSSQIGLTSGPTEPDKHDLMTKYDELAANCTERIRNLDSMISKVREEKQKILENTLSSAESLMSQTQKENVTDYMDIPNLKDVRINQKSEHNGNLISSPSSEKSTNAPSSDFSSTNGTAVDLLSNGNRINLTITRNKEFGESKDSGVGVSRPVTSSDFRDSPDLKQNTKGCDLESNKQLLSLALREEKQTKAESAVFEAPLDLNFCNLDSLKTTNNREKHPPIALTRYNPQIEDEIPHELSTITEVDTPATSRLTATDVNCNNNQLLMKNETLKNIPDNEVLKFLYNQFPNFKDYIMRNVQLSNVSINDSVDLTAATSAILGDKLENLFDVEVPAEFLKYQKFCSENENNETVKPKELEIAYTKFPSHSEYAQTASGLLDSQSIDRADLSDDTSLPDVLSELKARNIIDHSFEEASSGEGSFKDLLKVPKNLKKFDLTHKKADPPSDSLSENLEHDLNSIGLKWATNILRKSKEISTSSSSISSNHEDRSQRSLQRHSPKKISKILKKSGNKSFKDEKNENIANNISVRTEETQMKSMNLKDFLARELLKHSSMSSSSTDSSLASIFLKSFLEPSKDLSKMSETSPNRGTDKQRTSTPVQNSNESKGDSKINLSIKFSTVRQNRSENETSLPIAAANDLSKFFSGGSHLSSVRSTSTDSTTASSDERHSK